MAFSPDGERLLSGALDKTLRLWDALTGECLRVSTSSGVSFNRDGWPVENPALPHLIDLVPITALDGHSYTAREILEAPSLGLPITVTPLSQWIAPTS